MRTAAVTFTRLQTHGSRWDTWGGQPGAVIRSGRLPAPSKIDGRATIQAYSIFRRIRRTSFKTSTIGQRTWSTVTPPARLIPNDSRTCCIRSVHSEGEKPDSSREPRASYSRRRRYATESPIGCTTRQADGYTKVDSAAAADWQRSVLGLAVQRRSIGAQAVNPFYRVLPSIWSAAP